MGTWSSTAPTNLATGWTKVGDTGAINCYYCTRYRANGVWNNTWFYYVIKVIGYTARTTDNKAVQRIDFYQNDGNTQNYNLYCYPVATDSSGEIVGDSILNSPHTSSLTLIATRYYTTTDSTAKGTLTFGVYTNAYKGRGPDVGSVGSTVRINATVSGTSPILDTAIPMVKVSGSWKEGTELYTKINGVWKSGIIEVKNNNAWKT